MKTSAPTISALGSECGRAPGRITNREGAEPTRRGRCASSSALPPPAELTSSRA